MLQLRNLEEVAGRCQGIIPTPDTDVAVILCGHTHLPGTMRLDDGRLIVNPGSVGLPAYKDDHPWLHVVETGMLHARYAIVTRDGEAPGRRSCAPSHTTGPALPRTRAPAAGKAGRGRWQRGGCSAF